MSVIVYQFQTVRFIQIMSLTFGLFTQVSGSGPLGPLVLICRRVWKPVKSQGKIREKSGSFEVDDKWQPWILLADPLQRLLLKPVLQWSDITYYVIIIMILCCHTPVIR